MNRSDQVSNIFHGWASIKLNQNEFVFMAGASTSPYLDYMLVITRLIVNNPGDRMI